jgi:hypothetical protein
LLGRPLCAVSPKNSAIHFEVFRSDVGSWSSPHGRLSWASALLQSSSRTTATTLASHRHFREVLRPYSVSNRARIAPACPPTPSAFDVSTSLTGSSARDLRPDFSGPPLMGFTLRSFSLSLCPARCRVWNESRAPGVSLGPPLTFAHLPFPNAQADEKFAVSRIRSGFWALLPLRVRQPPATCAAHDPQLPWVLPLEGFPPHRSEPVVTGLPLPGLPCYSSLDEGCPSTSYSAVRLAFPRNGSWYHSSRCGRDAALCEVLRAFFGMNSVMSNCRARLNCHNEATES